MVLFPQPLAPTSASAPRRSQVPGIAAGARKNRSSSGFQSTSTYPTMPKIPAHTRPYWNESKFAKNRTRASNVSSLRREGGSARYSMIIEAQCFTASTPVNANE